jgi:hypothetical protein
MPGTVKALLLVMLLVTRSAAQSPVDLRTWTGESYPAVAGFGAGVWTAASDGSNVVQSVNGQPTLFVSDFNAFNSEMEGVIRVSTSGGDDDYIGFALGFEPGDSGNSGAEYLLIDWKRASQSFDFGSPSCTPSSLASEGLALSRATGIPTADEFWGHENFDEATCSDLSSGLQELSRGATLGDVGWNFSTDYRFRFQFGSTRVRIYVDDNLEMDVPGQFSDGRFAFYNFSQAAVTYSGFTVATLPSTTSTTTVSTTTTSSTTPSTTSTTTMFSTTSTTIVASTTSSTSVTSTSSTTTPSTSTSTSTLPFGLVPGGGPLKPDCYVELGMVGVVYPSDQVEKNKIVLCTDGDACDTGPCGDDACGVRVRLCINQQDENLADCVPLDGLKSVKVKPVGKVKLDVAAPQSLEGAQCGASFDGTIPVKVGKQSQRLPGKAKLKISAFAPQGTKPREDKDVITIQCLPRTEECPTAPVE